jgi:hypothetical protein
MCGLRVAVPSVGHAVTVLLLEIDADRLHTTHVSRHTMKIGTPLAEACGRFVRRVCRRSWKEAKRPGSEGTQGEAGMKA